MLFGKSHNQYVARQHSPERTKNPHRINDEDLGDMER
jgi:hypothetical protein